ncbi:hypothetical protein ACFL2A_03575, partial [Thermodesulfobacteriota bacterium]
FVIILFLKIKDQRKLWLKKCDYILVLIGLAGVLLISNEQGLRKHYLDKHYLDKHYLDNYYYKGFLDENYYLVYIFSLLISFLIISVITILYNWLQKNSEKTFSILSKKATIITSLTIIMSTPILFFVQGPADKITIRNTAEQVDIIDRAMFLMEGCDFDITIINSKEEYDSFENKHSIKLPFVDFRESSVIISCGKRVRDIYITLNDINEEFYVSCFNEEIDAMEALIINHKTLGVVEIKEDQLPFKYIIPEDNSMIQDSDLKLWMDSL